MLNAVQATGHRTGWWILDDPDEVDRPRGAAADIPLNYPGRQHAWNGNTIWLLGIRR